MLVTDPVTGQPIDSAELVARRAAAPGYTSGAGFASVVGGIAPGSSLGGSPAQRAAAAAGSSGGGGGRFGAAGDAALANLPGPAGGGFTLPPGLSGINFGAAGNAALANLPGYGAGAAAGGGFALPPEAGASGGANAWKGYSPAQKASFLKQSGNLDPVQYARLMGLVFSDTPWYQGGVQGVNVTPGYMPGNYTPRTDAGALYMINLRTGQNYGSLEEAKNAEELKYQIAGLTQYVSNQEAASGVYDEAGEKAYGARNVPGYLQNVSMQGFSDEPSWLRYINSLTGGNTAQQTAISQQRAALVPGYLPDVQRYLKEEMGLPYVPVELFGSPGMDINRDPSEPLYAAGANPASMIGLTGGQAGESAFYRSLSPEELLREIAPLYWAYYNRGAGEPVPAGMESGLTFGSPVNTRNVPGPDGTYTQYYQTSPVQGLTGRPQDIGAGTLAAEGLEGVTDPYELGRQLAGGLYNRWSAYGYPGTGSQSTVGGPLWDPETQTASEYRISPFSPGYASDPYFADFWAEPTFQPWQYPDPEWLQRLLAVWGSPSSSGTAFG